MRVDAHVSSRAGQRLALAVGNVLFCFGVTILFGHTEVDDMDDIGGLRSGTANQKVIGLDITVDEVLFVDGLDAGKLIVR